MSGKRSLPSVWASRGAIVAAVTGVGLVLFAVVGAVMLFAPSGDAPTTSRDVPASESTTEPVGDVAIEDEPTQAPTRARKPRHHVETVAPKPAPTPTAHPPAAGPDRRRAGPRAGHPGPGTAGPGAVPDRHPPGQRPRERQRQRRQRARARGA